MKTGKLSKREQEDLIIDFINAISLTKGINDVLLFLQDLLTKQEMYQLSKRLRIAKLLIKGWTYESIEGELKTSHTTVAKIAAWLSERGDGFRRIIEKLPEKKQIDPLSRAFDWDRFKRKYSLYFWPELLLEEIIKSASKKHKDRISEVLKKLDDKSDLHREIERLLRSNSNTT